MEDQAQGFVAMLETCFSELEDPRYENSCEHLLVDIIAITILGVSSRLFFKTSPSSFPAVGLFVGIFPFPLFPGGSKTVVFSQGYFSVIVANALHS